MEKMTLKKWSKKTPFRLLLLISQSSSGSRSVQVGSSTHFEGCDCALLGQGYAKLIDFFFLIIK